MKKISTGKTEWTVALSGAIDEAMDFRALIGDPPASLRVNCREIQRINSMGARGWIEYFERLQDRHVRLTFEECAIPVVEMLNYVRNFQCGGTIESFYAPFYCMGCRHHSMACFESEKVKADGFKLPALKCPKCDRSLVLDEDPEQYFFFLRTRR